MEQNIEEAETPAPETIFRWFVLAVEPQREAMVQRRAEEVGTEVYYPLARKIVRTMRGHKTVVSERALPAMGGYVFVKFGDGARFDLFRREFDTPDAVPHCVRWLSGLDGPEPLPSGVIEDIKRREQDGEFNESAKIGRYILPRWVLPGVKVRLIQGPFAGFPGAILRTVNRQMIRVSVQIMGRASEMEMPLDYLARLK